jgi:hypothetical protein
LIVSNEDKKDIEAGGAVGYEDHPVFLSSTLSEPPLSSPELRNVRMVLRQRATSMLLPVPSEIATAAHTRASQADFAERVYQARRARDRIFCETAFADPAWDLLLDIYVRSRRNERISISSACLGASVPKATALRYLILLVERKYVDREDHPSDKRSGVVRMSTVGIALMSEWIGSVMPDR